MAQIWARRIGYMEQNMLTQIHSPVLLGLRMFKLGVPLTTALLSNRVDFLALDPVDYLQAKTADPDIVPVIRAEPEKDFVLFARAGLGITKVAQVAGHSVAFGDTNQAATLMAKALLVQNGITGRDLTRYSHFSSLILGQRHDPVAHRGGDRAVIVAVLDQGYEVGVCTEKQFNKYSSKGFTILKRLPGYTAVYVARAGLKPELVTAFKNALLSLNGQDLFGDLALTSQLESEFEAVNDTYYQPLRKALKAAEQFDAGSSPTPSPPWPLRDLPARASKSAASATTNAESQAMSAK